LRLRKIRREAGTQDRGRRAKEDAKPETKVGAEAKDAKATDAKPAAAEVKPDIKPHPRWKPEVQEKFTKLAAADPDSPSSSSSARRKPKAW
jgi:hypothetical protein